MNKPGVSAKLKDVLQQVSTYDNVPRKKAKFQVGITSVCTNNYMFDLPHCLTNICVFVVDSWNNVLIFDHFPPLELDEKQS